MSTVSLYSRVNVSLLCQLCVAAIDKHCSPTSLINHRIFVSSCKAYTNFSFNIENTKSFEKKIQLFYQVCERTLHAYNNTLIHSEQCEL